MSDTPRPQDSVEQRLGLVARGVQRMADAFGSLEAEQRQALDLLRAIGSSIDAGAARQAAPAGLVDISGPIDRLIEAVRGLRDDIAADVAAMRETVGAPAAPVVDDDRLAAIENVVASLRDELAIDRLEASLRDMAQDTSGLRADVRRSFDRVLHEISSTEESLKGEVRAIDSRLTGFGDDLRLVRGLRDGLEALASGVDAVRQLAARSATSSQMGELARDLSTVLAEIETARSQVLSVDQQVGRLQAGAIDVRPDTPTPAAPSGHLSGEQVAKEVEDLERTVTDGIADLGARIEAIAERTVTAAEPDDPLAARLRVLATSARQLSMGIAEDLKARRDSKKKARKPAQQR